MALSVLTLALGSSFPVLAAQTALPPAALMGITRSDATAPRIHVAQSQDSAQLMVRIQQLEEQIRLLNGQIEGLTFQLTQMQEIVNRMGEDNEFRFQALEGGAGGKTDAVTQPGGVTQPEALPQDPDAVPMTDIPEQGVRPLPGEIEFDPTYTDGSAAPGDELGESSDPLLGTGAQGGVDLTTGEPLDLSFSGTPSGNADADAQFAAGQAALAEGDYAFAEDQFKQFLELYPDNAKAAEAASRLGDALLQRQAYTDAAEVLFSAFSADQTGPMAPELLLKLGVALGGAGERETACRTFDDLNQRFTSLSTDLTARLSAARAQVQCPPA